MNIPTRVHKNGHNSACDQYLFFHETCTTGFSTHRAINPCQKLNFYKNIPSGPFSHSRSHISHHAVCFITGRILKQALKSSRSNCTPKHMEELSLCSLFLLDVARKSDLQTGTPYRSGHHTVKDDNNDIITMATYSPITSLSITQECQRWFREDG